MSEKTPSRLPRERGRSLRLRSEFGASASPPGAVGEEHGETQPEQHSPAYRWLLVGIRYVLPVAVTVCGLVFMALGGETDLEGGASLVSAGLAIYFLNWLYRIGVTGDRERDSEEAARDYFARHGRWPS
jgi:hypothetical protein